MSIVGINEEIKYYFPDNEPLWYIGESLSERKELNEALNRESVKIDTIDELIHQVEFALFQDEPHASLVIMQNLPLEIETNLKTLVDALNIMPNVKVYEIGRDPIFKYGQYVPNLYKLKELSFEKTRSANIKIYTNPTDKQSEILQSLEIDLNISRAKVLELEQVILALNKEKEALEDKVKELSFDISEKYLNQIDTYKDKIEKLEEDIVNLTIDLKTERDKSQMHSKESADKTSLISELNYMIKAQEQKMFEKDNMVGKLKQKINNLEDDLDVVNAEKKKLLHTTVDEESLVILNENLERERERNSLLESDIHNLNIALKGKEFDIKHLQNAISEIRNGESDIITNGRTSKLDTGKLNKSTLIYLKVFEEIPFLRQYSSVLFEFINYKYKDSKKNLLVIIKNDEGMDDKLFHGLGLLQSFNDLEVGRNMYRLYPSPTMFSGLDSVDGNYGIVFIIDYIKSNEYYVTSSYKEIVMTSVSHSKKIQEYDLKGLPVSLDSDSVVNIKFDPTIPKRVLKQSRDIQVKQNVGNWFKNLKL